MGVLMGLLLGSRGGDSVARGLSPNWSRAGSQGQGARRHALHAAGRTMRFAAGPLACFPWRPGRY